MDTESLIRYLKCILSQQKNLIVLDRSIEYIGEKTPFLGIRNNYELPKAPSRCSFLASLSMSIVIFIVVTVIASIAVSIFTMLTGFIGIPWNKFVFPFLRDASSSVKWFGTSFTIGGALALVFSLFIFFIMRSKPSDDALHEYSEEMKAYEKNIEEQENRIKKELLLKKKLVYRKNELINQKSSIRENLNQLFSLNINGRPVLHKDYRDIVSVATIIGYLEARKCTELEGYQGAYNLYDQQKRYNTIISKLDLVIDHLEDIKYSQRDLYDAIHDVDNRVNRLNGEIMSISDNIQTGLCYKKIIAENTSTLLFLENMKQLSARKYR